MTIRTGRLFLLIFNGSTAIWAKIGIIVIVRALGMIEYDESLGSLSYFIQLLDNCRVFNGVPP